MGSPVEIVLGKVVFLRASVHVEEVERDYTNHGQGIDEPYIYDLSNFPLSCMHHKTTTVLLMEL